MFHYKTTRKMMSMLTCITCKVAFHDPETHRQHYKSDWHRYNLKRKVAELPAITHEEFHRRVLKQQDIEAENEKDKRMYCVTCHKYFICDKSYENHMNSKKHKLKEQSVEDMRKIATKLKETVVKGKDCEVEKVNLKKGVNDDDNDDIETDSEIEEVSSDEWNEDDANNPINNNKCLFCNHHSRSLLVNLKHMTEAHSFFVPDVEYCIDLKGLLLYLGSKIIHGHLCLWCNEKSKTFLSPEAARKHMIDKGHTKMYHEGEALLEYTPYYDYSTSYPDNEGKDPNEEVEIPELDSTGFELVLPSGVVIGHRSLFRYYKQNLNPNRGIVLRQKVNKVLSSYKQLGYTQLEKEIAQRKARDIKYMQKAQQKFYTQVGCKANKLQKHYRPQVNF